MRYGDESRTVTGPNPGNNTPSQEKKKDESPQIVLVLYRVRPDHSDGRMRLQCSTCSGGTAANDSGGTGRQKSAGSLQKYSDPQGSRCRPAAVVDAIHRRIAWSGMQPLPCAACERQRR